MAKLGRHDTTIARRFRFWIVRRNADRRIMSGVSFSEASNRKSWRKGVLIRDNRLSR
jgi:hypothetical protein